MSQQYVQYYLISVIHVQATLIHHMKVIIDIKGHEAGEGCYKEWLREPG